MRSNRRPERSAFPRHRRRQSRADHRAGEDRLRRTEAGEGACWRHGDLRRTYRHRTGERTMSGRQPDRLAVREERCFAVRQRPVGSCATEGVHLRDHASRAMGNVVRQEVRGREGVAVPWPKSAKSLMAVAAMIEVDVVVVPGVAEEEADVYAAAPIRIVAARLANGEG